MDSTDSQHLPFPENFDPGDGALDLQVLAEAIDAKLSAQFVAMRGAINKKLKVSTLAANTSAFADSTLIQLYPTSSTWTTVYDSTGGSDTANPYDLSGFTGGGVYRVGFYCRSQPSGTVDVNTERDASLNVQVALDASTPSTFQTQILPATSYDTNNGVVVQVVDSEIFLPFPGQFPFVTGGSNIRPYFFHLNTSSGVSILTGSLAWVERVGDLD
jgi:hypothetical protein